MEQAIKELERSLKYKERQFQEFSSKLVLLIEQKQQYEDDLLPKIQKEIEEIKQGIQHLQDLPF